MVENCAGAPRRPASGSGLSLLIRSWHAVLYDPGESDHRQFRRDDFMAGRAEVGLAVVQNIPSHFQSR